MQKDVMMRVMMHMMKEPSKVPGQWAPQLRNITHLFVIARLLPPLLCPFLIISSLTIATTPTPLS